MSRPVHFVAGFDTNSTCACGVTLAEQPDELITLDPDKVTCEEALESLGRPVRPAPDEVQLGGVGAPQAHWLGLIDSGITVTSAPECRGPDEPRVVLGMFNDGRILTHEQARALVQSVLAAIEWTGQ